ncbi:hypothetical protein ACHAWF_009340, partial [Thalassiosira exigua]
MIKSQTQGSRAVLEPTREVEGQGLRLLLGSAVGARQL